MCPRKELSETRRKSDELPKDTDNLDFNTSSIFSSGVSDDKQIDFENKTFTISARDPMLNQKLDQSFNFG